MLDRLWTWPGHICDLVCHGDLLLWAIQSFGRHYQQECSFLMKGHHFIIVLETYPLPRYIRLCSAVHTFLMVKCISSGSLIFMNMQFWLLVPKMQLKSRSRSNPSWNIQDEIRKVRAKATEEMLKTASSPSSVALASLEPKHISYVLDASLNVDGGVQVVLLFLYSFTCGNSLSQW